jgi:hypothetical protein
MPTFNAAERVKVSDQNSQERNKLGTVIARSGNNHEVRLDGFPTRQTRLFLGDQLMTTTLPNPLDYSNES